jgi:Leucine-rich repeat (LRR) protein
MKTFNKLSKITALIAMIWGFGLLQTGLAQLNPPQNLAYTVENENDVILYWNQPESDSALLHWDSGNNADSWGFLLDPEEYSCAAMWDPEHITSYDGWLIKKMRIFVVTDAPTEVQLKIWTGPEATEIYSQDITTYNVGAWTEIILDTPVEIDATTNLWAGLYINMPVPGTFMGLDEGPEIDGYGNLYYWNGEWRDDQGAGNWNIQLLIEPPVEPTYLHWDSGTNDDFFGFFLDGSYQFACAAKWNPEHITAYDGWEINTMRFYLSDATITELQLKIWTGPDGTEVYSQDVDLSDVNINDWTEITLDTPFTIDASTDLWGGIYIDMPAPGAPVGVDEGPLVDGQGFWLYYQDQWYDADDAGVNDNMNLQLGVVDPDERDGSRSMLGYNVYRNDVMLNTDPICPTVYVDENLYNGTYNYYVTAVYDEGESDPSNTVTVVIDAPVVIEQDSLALVDLYNSCGGPNWSNHDLWLEGPVAEWEGVVAENTRITQLWLQINNVTGDIPESIGDLTGLEKLHLESNNITSIPDNIGDMTALKEFWIGWNPITNIPESIGDLSNLEQLHIGFTNLGSLPESFGNLTNLTWLGAGDAGLNSLPESFGNLVSLESCFLWENNLTELPENFGGCASMKYLHLYENQLTELPESFGNMDNLYSLLLEDNLLGSLPESFGNMSSLHYLSISSNQLTALPDNFGGLDNLSILFASNNQLTELPESFSDLATLDSAAINSNALTSLPENIGDLPELKWFYLSYNGISELPESIGNLDSLRKLIVDVNDLSGLPESFTELPSIVYASFAVNDIETLPENIGDMNSLVTLNLNQNDLDSVPVSMGNMSSLIAIGLSENNLEDLPESMGDMDQLSTLIINGNNISKLPTGLLDNSFTYLYVQDNAFQFAPLEQVIGNVENFEYIPQAMIGTDTVFTIWEGSELSYTIEVSGDNNMYQWYKNNTVLPGQTSNTLYFASVVPSDMGIYVLRVTNSIVPDLELISHNVVLDIMTGMDKNEADGFNIYPNPAGYGAVNITLNNPQNVASVSLINTSGQTVLYTDQINQNIRLDISHLVKGLYMVKVHYTDGQTATEKLIVGR